jgi:hypothetical protein
LYDVNVDWESRLDLKEDEMTSLRLLINRQYPPMVYRFTHVYGTLGNAFQAHLTEVPNKEVFGRVIWDERKKFTMIAFETLEDIPSICSHIGELIIQDRYLRKIQKTSPKNMESWHSASRYFPI